MIGQIRLNWSRRKPEGFVMSKHHRQTTCLGFLACVLGLATGGVNAQAQEVANFSGSDSGGLTLRDGGLAFVDTVEVNAGRAIQGIGGVTGTVANNGGVLAPAGRGFSVEINCASDDPVPEPGPARTTRSGCWKWTATSP